MSRRPTGFTGKILTANDLLSGEVIYLGKDGLWVNRFELAEIISDPLCAIDHLAEADTQNNTIVGPYLIEAAQSLDGCPAPAHFREGFRMRGPSNMFHGKQAEHKI